jgi:SH3 domain
MHNSVMTIPLTFSFTPQNRHSWSTLNAEAVLDHVTIEPDELDFRAGDEISVINSVSDRDWWWGQTATATGWFPAAFVVVSLWCKENICSIGQHYITYITLT